MSPLRRPRRARRQPGDRLTLLAVGGRVSALVCPLCAALVLADGADAHARSHTAGADR